MKWLRLLPLLLFVVLSAASGQNRYEMECTGTDAWLPLGDGLSGPAIDAVEFDGELYVLHTQGPTQGGQFQISAWNGTAWRTVSSFAVKGYPFALDAYNGNIYIAGTFDDINGIANTRSIAMWDGSNWNSVGGGVSLWGTARDIEAFNGELYLTGSFEGVGGIDVKSIARWNGTSWNDVGGGITYTYVDSAAYGLAIKAWNGSLYVSGTFDQAGGDPIRSLARWDGNAWSAVGDPQSYPTDMIGFNGELHTANTWNPGAATGKVNRWDGSQWHILPGSDTMSSGKLAVHNNQLYSSGAQYQQPTDSGITKLIVKRAARWDGTSWHPVSGFDDEVSGLVSYNGELYAYGRLTNSCGTPVSYIARYCDENNCAKVSGNVYRDFNDDCIKDAGDEGLTHRIVEIQPGPVYAMTDADGNYSRILPGGTYTLSLAPYLYWNTTCPNSGTHSVTLAGAGSTATADFASVPTPGIRDLRVSIAGGRPRPGFQTTYTIRYENVGTEPVSGTITLTYDGRLTFDSSQAGASRVAGNSAEWDFQNLEMGASGVIRVYMTLASTAQLGTQLCAFLDVELEETDQLLGDNRDSVCQEVRGSYDPNDISVTPLGSDGEEPGLTPADTVLTYQIRFQNTGTDTAFTVVVVDTLSQYLDMATLKLGATSHPYRLTINESGALAWTFANIMLPDSHANEVGSHGYLKYSVRLRPGLAANTQIPNRAGIYFDYNAPVITNTVISVIGSVSSVPTDPQSSLRLYPNPTSGRLELEAAMVRGGRVWVETSLGERVGEYVSDGSGRVEVNLSGLPVGMYLVRVETGSGVVTQKVQVIR